MSFDTLKKDTIFQLEVEIIRGQIYAIYGEFVIIYPRQIKVWHRDGIYPNAMDAF